MPRGGSRPGAGRAKGAINKVSAAKIEAIRESGQEMPFDYMMRIMNDPKVEHTRRDAMSIAAAPYAHSKLATITGKDGGPIEHRLEVTWKDPE